MTDTPKCPACGAADPCSVCEEQLRGSPAPAAPAQLTNPSTLAGNVNNPGVVVGLDFSFMAASPTGTEFREELNRQHRAIVDAAVQQEREDSARVWSAKVVEAVIGVEKDVRAEVAPLIAKVREWKAIRLKHRAVLDDGSLSRPIPFPRMPMTELKPCPFCGNTPDVNHPYTFQSNQGDKWGYVVCCCQGPEVRTSYEPVEKWRDAAIAAWNRRTP